MLIGRLVFVCKKIQKGNVMIKTIKIYGLATVILVAAAGCQMTGWNQTPQKTASVNTEKKQTKTAENPVVRKYRRTDGYDFAQVSLFGDLPGMDTSIQESQPMRSLQQHTFTTEGASFDPSVSPDGTWLSFASTQHNIHPDIYIKRTGASSITQITSNPASDVQPVFDANSRRIAFCSDRTGSWDIFMVGIDGRQLQQLSDDPAPEMHPSFSPDGTKLAYCRYNTKSRQWEIWLLYLDNPQHRKFITTGLFPSFSPSEDKIVYQRPKQRGTQWFSIWTISLTSDDQPSMPTEVVSGTDRALIGPNWSPDGKKIVYCAVRPQAEAQAKSDAQIWIVQSSGQGKMPVSDSGIGCYNPDWSKDGRIFFCSNRGNCENIWSVMPMMVKNQLASELKANHPVQLNGNTGH